MKVTHSEAKAILENGLEIRGKKGAVRRIPVKLIMTVRQRGGVIYQIVAGASKKRRPRTLHVRKTDMAK
jgi:hypothetical protein